MKSTLDVTLCCQECKTVKKLSCQWNLKTTPKRIAMKAGWRRVGNADVCPLCFAKVKQFWNSRTPWKEEALKRRKNGETLKSIAASFGVTRERVRQVTQEVRTRKCGGCAATIPIHHMYCKPCTKRRRAEYIWRRCACGRGMGPGTHRICIKCKMAETRKSERYVKTVALYRRGLSAYDIAPQLGISIPAVYAILRRMNEPRRPKGRPKVFA